MLHDCSNSMLQHPLRTILLVPGAPARKSECPNVPRGGPAYTSIHSCTRTPPGLRILAISRTGTTNNAKDPIFWCAFSQTTGPFLTTSTNTSSYCET
jgi:hypothetical protein